MKILNKNIYCVSRLVFFMASFLGYAITAQAEWQASVGMGAANAPRYEGAAEDRLWVVPLFDVSFNKGKFFASITRGIGYGFSDSRFFQYGIRIGVGNARSESADPRLYGMGDLDYIPEAGVFARLQLGPLSLSSNVATGDYGTHGDANVSLGFALGESDRIRFSGSRNWGNEQYMQTYFGVTTAQALASGNVLTQYTPQEGVKDLVLGVNWTHNFGKSWFSSLSISRKTLEGPALLSPLTQRVSFSTQSIVLGYRF